MIAYKFLRAGAVGAYSGFRWPTPAGASPGEWVEVDGPRRLASNAIHACRVDQLPYWLNTELWELELSGSVEEAENVLFGSRGRLLRPVQAWDGDVASEFALACLERARLHATRTLVASGEERRADDLESGAAPEQLMASAAAAAGETPPTLAAVLAGTADAAFSCHVGLSACLVGFLTARVARAAADATDARAGEASDEERRWQALWLADRLELAAG